jgi:hypothetical protein
VRKSYIIIIKYYDKKTSQGLVLVANMHTTGNPNSYIPKPERATKGTAERGLKNLNKNTTNYS